MAQTAIAARRIKAIGSVTEMVAGVLSVSNSTTTLVLPQFREIQGVVCSSSTSDKAAVATTISGNTITFDHESATGVVAYIAWGLGLN